MKYSFHRLPKEIGMRILEKLNFCCSERDGELYRFQ